MLKAGVMKKKFNNHKSFLKIFQEKQDYCPIGHKTHIIYTDLEL